MMSTQPLWAGCLWLVAVALTACKKEPEKTTAPSAAPSALAPAPSAAPAKPWYVGAWGGDYSASQFKVESGPGAVKDWTKDDGSKASGPGKLVLRISEEGAIEGEGEGSLGALKATGQIDGDTVRATLRPGSADAAGFSGFLLGAREGDVIKARLQASSGDSLTVRQATVELKKQPP
jgi:hypothetical protein